MSWELKLKGDQKLQAQRAPLSERVQAKIKFVATLLPEETDWLRVKKQLLLELPPVDRQLFSSRDPYTKLHHPFNPFEIQVRQAWTQLTGNVLKMPVEKMLESPDKYEP